MVKTKFLRFLLKKLKAEDEVEILIREEEEEKEGAAVATTSTELQSDAIGVIDWAISSMNALPGTKKPIMLRI